MKKLNNKGYMLVEIIMASLIAMGIGYYLIDLTYDFVEKNNNLHDSFYMLNTKTVITKNIMNDIYGKDIQNLDYSNPYEITFTIKQNTEEQNEEPVEEQVEEQADDTDDTMLNTEQSGNEQTTELNNNEINEERRMLKVRDNKTIEYGKIGDNGAFYTNDISYYKKTLDDNINIDSVSFDNNCCLKITISNIYLKDTYEIILPIINRQNN